MSLIASLRKIPKWQLGVTSGLLFWAAALQVGALVTLPCIQHIRSPSMSVEDVSVNWCESDNRTEPSSLAKFEYDSVVMRHEVLLRISTVAYPHG